MNNKALSRREIQTKLGISERTFFRKLKTGAIKPLYRPVDPRYQIVQA